jgi:hypothetical protein
MCYPVNSLTVRPAKGWGLLWAVPAYAGMHLGFTWIHTVSKRPVCETYTIEPDGSLRLLEMVFDHEGPNLPSTQEQGTTWRIEHNKVIVTGYELHLDGLNFGVSPLGHRISVGRLEWDLVAGFDPDRLARVTVERIPLGLVVLAEVWQWRHKTRRS